MYDKFCRNIDTIIELFVMTIITLAAMRGDVATCTQGGALLLVMAIHIEGKRIRESIENGKGQK